MSGEKSGAPTTSGVGEPSVDPVEWVEPTGRSSGAVTQEEIDSILNDPLLAPTEREARLRDLRQRVLDADSDSGEESYAPLQVRIMDALAMVAEGGHDYDNHLRVEGEAVEPGDAGPADAAPGVAVRDKPRTS